MRTVEHPMKTLALIFALAATAYAEPVMLKVCPAYPEPIPAAVVSPRAAIQPSDARQIAAIQPVAQPAKSRSFVRGSVNVSVALTVKRW